MEIKFCFPDVGHELYDHHTKIAYIFCLRNDNACELIEYIEDYINHAWLHYLIQGICGSKASLKFDKIIVEIAKWDKETYKIL